MFSKLIFAIFFNGLSESFCVFFSSFTYDGVFFFKFDWKIFLKYQIWVTAMCFYRFSILLLGTSFSDFVFLMRSTVDKQNFLTFFFLLFQSQSTFDFLLTDSYHLKMLVLWCSISQLPCCNSLRNIILNSFFFSFLLVFVGLSVINIYFPRNMCVSNFRIEL